jgi:hypothetical protein
MSEQTNLQDKAQGEAEDTGRYFQYMADFVGLSKEDISAIQQTASIIEHHLPEIISKFYSHLLRYPPTRKFFLKKNGSIDQEYIELRMPLRWLLVSSVSFWQILNRNFANPCLPTNLFHSQEYPE